MSSSPLRDITLKQLEQASESERKSLFEGDSRTIDVLGVAAREAIDLMVHREAIESGHDDADPDRLVRRVIAALAHPEFFKGWIGAMLPRRSDAEKMAFGDQFDRLHRFDGDKKPRSSWVDLGVSLLMETERPWWSDGLTSRESRERFHVAVWCGEVIPHIAKRLRDDCPGWLRSDLDRPWGAVEVWLWRLHWGPGSKFGPFTGRPSLGPYLGNLAFCGDRNLSRGLNKGTRIVDPMTFGFSAHPAGAWDFDSDSEEAGWYRWFLLGETDVSSKIVPPHREHRRFPLSGRLRSLLERNAHLLVSVGLGDVLEQAVGRLGTVIRREYARAYHIDGKDAATITKEITKQRCRCEEHVNRKRQRCTCPSKTNRILNDLWQEFGKNEIGRKKKDGLDDALGVVEMAGRGGGGPSPPNGGGQPHKPNGGGPDASTGRSDGGTTGAGNGQDGGPMRIDERTLSAIKGITNLQTGEWSRDEVPDQFYGAWVDALGPDMVEMLLQLDRYEPSPAPPVVRTVEEEILSLLMRELPARLRALAAFLFTPGLRWVPTTGGTWELAPTVPFTLPATYVLGTERWRLTGDRRDMVLTCLTAGHDPVADGSIRIEGEDVVVTPAYPADDTWRAFVAAPTGEDPLDRPGDRVVFLINRAESPASDVTRLEDRLTAHALIAAWQGALVERLSDRELDSWIYLLLTHSEELLNAAYPAALEHLREPADRYVLRDLDPERVAGRIDSMKYVLLDRLREDRID